MVKGFNLKTMTIIIVRKGMESSITRYTDLAIVERAPLSYLLSCGESNYVHTVPTCIGEH